MNPRDVKVVYASMEIALGEGIPTYSGGLGAYSGDTVKTAADLGLPVAFFSLMVHKGYFTQVIENGVQKELPTEWSPEKEGFRLLPTNVEVKISGRDVKVQPWEKTYSGAKGDVKLYLLDTDIEGNSEWDRHITDKLYDSGGGEDHDYKKYYRLCQEAILGIGAVRMARALGYTNAPTFQINDCHPALMAYELLLENKFDADKARKYSFFTTHTPVDAGFDAFSSGVAELVLGGQAVNDLRKYAYYNGSFNMAYLALNLSRGINAVSKKHAEVCRGMDIFKGHDIFSITNGVHASSWTSDEMGELLTHYLGDWKENPQLFLNSDIIPLEAILGARKPSELKLVQRIKDSTGVEFDPSIPTIDFGKRAALYKRGDLAFHDVKKLAEISRGRFQYVFAMKAHPSDDPGKELIQKVWQGCNELRNFGVNAVFLDDYSYAKASDMVRGSMIWLNNPERPLEACGTSGMKVLPNGGLNLSILDGWWHEAYNGYNGFAIAPENHQNNNKTDAESLYYLLNGPVKEAFKDKKLRQFLMRNSMKLAAYFNTTRMIKEYAEKAWNMDLGELEKKHFAGFSLNGSRNGHNGNGSKSGLEVLVEIIKSANPLRKN